MIAYAAIDLRGGRVVQLVGGRTDAERVSLPDPGNIARTWIGDGFAMLHVVDLDAAFGTGNNDAAIADVINVAGPTPVQVGGGIRTAERAEALIDAGAARIVLGTRAIEDPAWLEELARRWPQRVVLAADTRAHEVVVRGWTEGSRRTTTDLLRDVAHLPLAGVLVTDVEREGSMNGADIARFERLAAATHLPILASGGIAGEGDLADLARVGVAGAIIGMALYTGALDVRAVTRDYSA